ncbi:YheT family hydrolase [Chitinimonas lacunae]|uniref:YheT family hydrolase n=1 Tax=Chitinimonas lacunae TaxID=1963018 RepID=A0ABV8MM81_9NEIS
MHAYLPPYHPSRWLVGGHIETIYPALALRPAGLAYRREIWETPDGDQVAVDWLDGPRDAPLVVQLHGLEGSSASHYALALMHSVRARRWRGVVPHFRGCGGLPNRRPRAYHAGDTEEIAWYLQTLRSRHDGPIVVAGVSLGGNVLLKWLGENGPAASQLIVAAAAVSAPLDLQAAGSVLGSGFNKHVYTRAFLNTLRPKTLGQLGRFGPELAQLGVSATKVAGARTLREFDQHVTAPLHGFHGVDDYWQRASAKPWLSRIALPTLVLNARNDPFLPASALPGAAEVSDFVTLLQPERGGHVGFAEGQFPGRIDWLPRCLMAFFGAQLDGLAMP